MGRRLRRWGLGRLRQLHPDIEKLARIDGVGHRSHGHRRRRKRGIGRDFVHVAIDDASRVSDVELLPDTRGTTATGFLERAVAWFAHGGLPTASH